MKKILIATTALVATAGVAAADVNLSGSARFGVVYDKDQATKAGIHNRFTLNIDATTEADNGAEFFARVRVRGENERASSNASGVSAPRVGVTVNGLTVAVGNINGAIDSLPGLYDGSIGLTGLSYSNVANNNGANWGFDSFSSAGGGSNGVEAIYNMNGFGIHASYSDQAAGARGALGLSYAFGDWTVALGYQKSERAGEDFATLTVGGNMGAVSVGAAYAANEGDNDAIRLSAGFEVGAGTNVTVYVSDNQGAGKETAYGIGMSHSLGGATLKGGIENDRTGTTRGDFGVSFNF